MIPISGAALFVAIFLAFSDLGMAEDIEAILKGKVDESIKLPNPSPEAVEHWKGQRFGLFIHWWPQPRLEPQYNDFNPVNCDPEAIVKLAKYAGMNYVVVTARHKEGLSMFDSKATDYDITSTAYGKDTLKELEQACRKHRLNFGKKSLSAASGSGS